MDCELLALLLYCSLFSCQALPVKREATKVEKECRQLGELNCALYSFKDIQKRYSFTPGHKILCYMYDQYIQSTLIREWLLQNRPMVNDIQYRQNLAWKSLNSTCKWLQLNESIAPSGCNLPEIREVCADYRSYKHQMKLLDEFNEQVKEFQTTNPDVKPSSDFEIVEFIKAHYASRTLPTTVSIACDLPLQWTRPVTQEYW